MCMAGCMGGYVCMAGCMGGYVCMAGCMGGYVCMYMYMHVCAFCNVVISKLARALVVFHSIPLYPG